MITDKNSSLPWCCVTSPVDKWAPEGFLLAGTLDSCFTALFWNRWHYLSYFVIRTARINLSCFYSSYLMAVHLLKISFKILIVFDLSSKCAVNQSMFIMMSTRGMPVKTWSILWLVYASAESDRYSSTIVRESWLGSNYNCGKITLSISLKMASLLMPSAFGPFWFTMSKTRFRYFECFVSKLPSCLSPILLSFRTFSGL